MIKVRGYKRVVKGRVVYVRPYHRADAPPPVKRLSDQETLEKLFGYAGESLIHATSRVENPEDNFGRAALLGMSSDEGYAKILTEVHKGNLYAIGTVRRVDNFIGRNGDTPCEGLFSGTPISSVTLGRLRKGGQVDISHGLPIYATKREHIAESFRGYGMRPTDKRCVFEIVGGSAVGNNNHLSKHSYEDEVCFKSTTRVTVVENPIRLHAGTEDEYYRIKVKFD